jgi:CrcB protein
MNPPTFLTSSLYVAIGGAAGSWLRYSIGRLWIGAIGQAAANAFPWATLTVNVVGSFAMGLLAGWLARDGAVGAGTDESWRLLLGGFTTFSAFSLELGTFIQRGSLGTAALYMAVSLIVGIAGLFAGLAFIRVVA